MQKERFEVIAYEEFACEVLKTGHKRIFERKNFQRCPHLKQR